MQRNRKILTTTIVYMIILGICFFFLVPIFGAFSMAFRLNKEIIREGFWVLPNPPTVSNFLHVLREGKIQRFFSNTVIVTTFATAFSILMGCLTGYAFGKLEFKWKNVIYIAGMFFLRKLSDPSF